MAFVATVYGVGSANLFFLPAANKVRARTHHDMQIKELMLEGVIAIIEGLNPKLIRTKLEAYTRDATPTSSKVAKPVRGAAPVAEPQSRRGVGLAAGVEVLGDVLHVEHLGQLRVGQLCAVLGLDLDRHEPRCPRKVVGRSY